MAIRVTQNTMYNNMVGHMQSNLSGYMESVQQGSSQKKINRPSDDPAGTYRVLTTRNDMVATAQYQENVDTAKGWLNLADQVLSTNVATAITGLKTLAEQASTGTYDASQRLIMADQARQYFGQLLNLSNTQFEDKQIFAGHKYDQSAFSQGLAATSWDENWEAAINSGMVQVEGESARSVLIEFTSTASLNELKDGDTGPAYRWSNDGGLTWQNDTAMEETDDLTGETVLRLKPQGIGVTATIRKIEIDNPAWTPGEDNEGIPEKLTGYYIPNPEYKKNDPLSETNPAYKDLSVIAANSSESSGAKNGTFLYLRPAAFYNGDDKDPPVDVRLMGAGEITNTPNAEKNPITASGAFGKNMLVRIDGQPTASGEFEPVDLYDGGNKFQWSYSTDGGSTWVTAYGQTSGDGTLRLPVPGGYMDFDLNVYNRDGEPTKEKINDGMLFAGMQANIHPSRSDLDYEILKDTYMSVNSVGKDVFGGYYEGKPAMDDQENNLFEVVGAFIGYLEGNNQEGCQRTLAALTKAEKTILAEATRIGGLENRVSMAADVLSFQKIDQQERLSYTEDIDLTELLTRLTRQQLTYQTVLQSSSMIMKLSLMNYV